MGDAWRMAEALRPLLYHIALRHRGLESGSVGIDDMVQVGVLGAVAAMRTFDPEKGDAQAHMARRAESEMVRHALRHGGPVTMPYHHRRQAQTTPLLEHMAGAVSPWQSAVRDLDRAWVLRHLAHHPRRRIRIAACWMLGESDAEQAERRELHPVYLAQLRREGAAMLRDLNVNDLNFRRCVDCRVAEDFRRGRLGVEP